MNSSHSAALVRVKPSCKCGGWRRRSWGIATSLTSISLIGAAGRGAFQTRSSKVEPASGTGDVDGEAGGGGEGLSFAGRRGGKKAGGRVRGFRGCGRRRGSASENGGGDDCGAACEEGGEWCGYGEDEELEAKRAPGRKSTSRLQRRGWQALKAMRRGGFEAAAEGATSLWAAMSCMAEALHRLPAGRRRAWCQVGEPVAASGVVVGEPAGPC